MGHAAATGSQAPQENVASPDPATAAATASGASASSADRAGPAPTRTVWASHEVPAGKKKASNVPLRSRTIAPSDGTELRTEGLMADLMAREDARLEDPRINAGEMTPGAAFKNFRRASMKRL